MTNQIMKPVVQLFTLVLEQLKVSLCTRFLKSSRLFFENWIWFQYNLSSLSYLSNNVYSFKN